MITHWKTNPFDVIALHTDGYEYYLKQLPDYPNDLNAIHEVEATLTLEQWREYCTFLNIIVAKDPKDEITIWKNYTHATAQQKFEALGPTLKLWRMGE